MHDLRLTQPNKEKRGARSKPIFALVYYESSYRTIPAAFHGYTLTGTRVPVLQNEDSSCSTGSAILRKSQVLQLFRMLALLLLCDVTNKICLVSSIIRFSAILNRDLRGARLAIDCLKFRVNLS